MPDIAMCQQRECPLKASCYRYRAVPSEPQDYMEFPGREGCHGYWVIGWYRTPDGSVERWDAPTRTMEEIEDGFEKTV